MDSFPAESDFDGGPEYDTPDVSLSLDPTVINTSADGADLQDPTSIVTKTRRPQVKLTGEKLCSPKGLPYVARNARKHIRISKRKSPYDNLCNVMQFYQLWAHDLFPKAKFGDFVAMCNTLAKTDKDLRAYRIQLVREELGLFTAGEEDAADFNDPTNPTPAAGATPEPARDATPNAPSLFVANDDANEDSSDEDLYTLPGSRTAPDADEELELLREAEGLLDMQPSHDGRHLSSRAGSVAAHATEPTQTVLADDGAEDEDELALMREMGL
ncbi:LAFE_0H01860g1_1 [Lachancea fermentati]|uniref:Chromosome segregation in meiosis protein n=1 Tax=Lachancea fermentati TaxID=4955 RepID=A0A1G4MJ67_LACFM|nr:LAFE_0H01860g1_1 [Lachancea fermentati]